MPVYKVNKALSAINTHTKDVDRRYLSQMVFYLKKVFWNGPAVFNGNYNSNVKPIVLSQGASTAIHGITIHVGNVVEVQKGGTTIGKVYRANSGAVNISKTTHSAVAIYKSDFGNVTATLIDDTHVQFADGYKTKNSTWCGSPGSGLDYFLVIESITRY